MHPPLPGFKVRSSVSQNIVGHDHVPGKIMVSHDLSTGYNIAGCDPVRG